MDNMVVEVNRYARFCKGTILARGTVADESGRRFAFVEFAQDIGSPPSDEAVIAAARPLLAAKFAAGDCRRESATEPKAVVTGPVLLTFVDGRKS